MAHTIFNAVTGVTLEEELNETRHFHSMGDWLQVLSEHELHNSSMMDSCYIRPGDPSRNMMACFINTKELSLEKNSTSLSCHAQAQVLIKQNAGFNLSRHGLFAAGQARNAVVDHEKEVVDEYSVQTTVTCP